jgi:hypothetical protein
MFGWEAERNGCVPHEDDRGPDCETSEENQVFFRDTADKDPLNWMPTTDSPGHPRSVNRYLLFVAFHTKLAFSILIW